MDVLQGLQLPAATTFCDGLSGHAPEIQFEEKGGSCNTYGRNDKYVCFSHKSSSETQEQMEE
jgi:hypothetical protein